MKMIVIEDVCSRLEQHENTEECWLYCDECRRFFQYLSHREFGVRSPIAPAAASGSTC